MAAPAPRPDAPLLRTLLLTDLCDSTSLVERLGDAPAAALFREHDLLVLRLQQAWRGRLIDRSDGLLLLFERPIDGLGFALDYARGLRELGAGRGHVLQARAGLHVGEVLTWRNSDEAVRVGAKPLEVEGLAKPTAGRLMAMARPGQILLSAVAEPLTHRAARELGTRGEQLVWKSHGRWRFKGVPQVQEIFEVGEPGHAPLRPPANSAKAWRDIPLWRRPAALAAQAAVLGAIAVGSWFALRPQPAIAFGERDWVVVADLRNLTGQPVLDESLEQAFRISLEQSRYVNVLSDMKARDTLARMRRPAETRLDRAIASEIALRDGARAVILPTVSEVGGRVRVSAEVIDPATQATAHVELADGKGLESVLASVDAVSNGLRQSLGEAVPAVGRDFVPLPRVTTRNLDALRAYALAQNATGRKDWREARALYERAVKLDPEFALAHVGLARLSRSGGDVVQARASLARALALRTGLPPRDQLYLDAWAAEVSEQGTPLDEWRRLAALYPDFSAGAANAAWYLLVDNRYREALDAARPATVRQEPLRAFALEHVGRAQLALGAHQQALDTFREAEATGRGAIRETVHALAAGGRFSEAAATLDKIRPSREPPGYFSVLDRMTLALDQKNASRALDQAGRMERLVAKDVQWGPHFTLAAQYGRYAADPGALDPRDLDRLVTVLSAQLQTPKQVERQAVAMRLLAAAYLGYRAQAPAIADVALRNADAGADDEPVLEWQRLRALVGAQQALTAGDPNRAVAQLKPQIDGSELLQAHVVLASAYAALGDTASARRHTTWLAEMRGRAYAEINAEQVLLPINVADARAAADSLRMPRRTAG